MTFGSMGSRWSKESVLRLKMGFAASVCFNVIDLRVTKSKIGVRFEVP